jgi:hypothetical protein
LIPTEIGPLPSDLWHLIGQTPPEQPAGGITPEAPSSVANDQTMIQETPYPSSPEPEAITVDKGTDEQTLTRPPLKQAIPDTTSAALPTSKTDTAQAAVPIPDQLNQVVMQEIAKAEKPNTPARGHIEFPHPVIQRLGEEEQTTTPGSTTSSGGEETSQQTPTLSDEDLDKLARQVYDEIRQKLSIERERTRGRM